MAAKQMKEDGESTLDASASICGVFVVWLFVVTFLFQNFEIPSGSMIGALLIGDHVLVDKIAFAPSASWSKLIFHRQINRGDVVVFIKPNEPKVTLVKRVIGVPGDRIHLRNGIVYLNGTQLNEHGMAMPTIANYQPYRDDFPSVPATEASGATAVWAVELASHLKGEDLVVPANNYFMMGDNRTISLDSRFWGFVPQENVLGYPLFVYWSFRTPADQMYRTELSDRVAFGLHVAFHFFDQTRWRRTLLRIR
jgi:signal peptidase I